MGSSIDLLTVHQWGVFFCVVYCLSQSAPATKAIEFVQGAVMQVET